MCPTLQPPADPGLEALLLLLHLKEVPADRGQIRHRLGTEAIGVPEMLRCARDLGLKARTWRTDWSRLSRTPLPAIAVLRDGGFMVLAKASDDKVLVQSPRAGRPAVMTREELAAVWDGGLVVMTRRASLGDLARRFDIGWFMAAVDKYRRLLGEVLVASFFLQLFALVSPLFFQVVIDKVLVHRSLGTLDVLVIGLLAIALFETVLAVLRTYLFSHTTNRIDVELGARLFRHLLALPMAYFQSRRVGDSVARVRELENIRNFLTSSALTLVIDLFFTFVFLAVMFFYAPTLTWIVVGSLPLYVVISASVAPLFRRRLDEKFQRGAENQAFLVESVTGIETLKAMAVEPQMQRRWEEQLAAYVSSGFRVLSLGNAASQSVQFVSKAVTAAILYFGAKLVIDGSLSVGDLVAFNILASRVSAPVLRLAQMWQDFHQARLSVARLGDILNTAAEPAYAAGRARLPALQGGIRFDHVSFRYRLDGPQILHDVSFDIPAGQTVGIVGPSGSGKSTFAKLVQRLYVPESGRVLVDGMDLSMVDPAWLRRQDRRRPAGERAVQPLGAGEHRAGRPDDADRARGRRGAAGRRTRLHPRAQRRLRHGRRRARLHLVGRPAPAHRHCPRPGHRSAHPDLRRGDQRARLRKRAHRPAEHEGDHQGAHGPGDRASAVDSPCHGSHRHARGRPRRRGRHARRLDQDRRPLRLIASPAGRNP